MIVREKGNDYNEDNDDNGNCDNDCDDGDYGYSCCVLFNNKTSKDL